MLENLIVKMHKGREIVSQTDLSCGRHSVTVNICLYLQHEDVKNEYIAGFELVFDHWGTICPLSKNFGGHFHF